MIRNTLIGLLGILCLLVGYFAGYATGLKFTTDYAAEQALLPLKEIVEKAYRAGAVAEYGHCQETVVKLLNQMVDGTEE